MLAYVSPLINYNIKFKYFQMILVSPTTEEYDLLHKQLLERLDTGKGEIIYDIGVGEGTLKNFSFYL